MASTFWRIKRKKKILANRPKFKGSGRLARIRGHAKAGGMISASMAADEIRSKGVDRVTGAFDRIYFNIDRKGRDVKNKDSKTEGLSEQQLDEIWGTVAKVVGKVGAKKLAGRAAARATTQASKRAAKVSAGAAGNIARRTAPKVTQKVAQSALDLGPVKYVQKRSGKGLAAMTRKKSHRINAMMRRKRMLRSKEMRMKPATAMAKAAAKTAAGDVAMRSVVDVGSHVISTPAKTAYDKAAGVPERHSTRGQARNRQQAQNQQRSQFKHGTGSSKQPERLTAGYDPDMTISEKVNWKMKNKKFGGQHHSVHNAMVSIHRTQQFKPTAIKNNPSGNTRTNTRSRQNSDVTRLDNIIEASVRRIEELGALGAGLVVKTVLKPE